MHACMRVHCLPAYTSALHITHSWESLPLAVVGFTHTLLCGCCAALQTARGGPTQRCLAMKTATALPPSSPPAGSGGRPRTCWQTSLAPPDTPPAALPPGWQLSQQPSLLAGPVAVVAGSLNACQEPQPLFADGADTLCVTCCSGINVVLVKGGLRGTGEGHICVGCTVVLDRQCQLVEADRGSWDQRVVPVAHEIDQIGCVWRRQGGPEEEVARQGAGTALVLVSVPLRPVRCKTGGR